MKRKTKGKEHICGLKNQITISDINGYLQGIPIRFVWEIKMVQRGRKMAITKYESYYLKILENLKLIKADNEYKTDSIAFAHWYLENYYKLHTQDIAEAIIDGDGDLGIDSILIDEDNSALAIMQYKLPSKKENINCEIAQGDILKAWNGSLTLISNDKPYTGKNRKFEDFKRQLENTVITNFRICFVSYNKGGIAIGLL